MRLGYGDVDTFVERFAPNVTRGGVFISSKTPRPVGDSFRFEIALAGGPTVLSGQGKVTWIRDFDPEAPRKPHGMGVQFLHVDEETFPILERLIAAREGARARRRSSLPARSRTAIPPRRTSPIPMAEEANLPQSLRGQVEPNSFDQGVSEDSISRAIHYARVLSTSGEQDLEQGAAPAPKNGHSEAVTLDQALSGLSQMLRPRSKSGLYQLPPDSAWPKNKE